MISASTSGNSTFAKDDQKDICDTFTGVSPHFHRVTSVETKELQFVKTQQDLLQALVSQKGLLGPIPLSMPIAAILRFLETYVDRLSLAVIGTVPTCAEESKMELKGLDKNFNETLDAYPIKLHLPESNGTSLEAFLEAYLEGQ